MKGAIFGRENEATCALAPPCACPSTFGQWLFTENGVLRGFAPPTQIQKDIWVASGHADGKKSRLSRLRWRCTGCGTVQMPTRRLDEMTDEQLASAWTSLNNIPDASEKHVEYAGAIVSEALQRWKESGTKPLHPLDTFLLVAGKRLHEAGEKP